MYALFFCRYPYPYTFYIIFDKNIIIWYLYCKYNKERVLDTFSDIFLVLKHHRSYYIVGAIDASRPDSFKKPGTYYQCVGYVGERMPYESVLDAVKAYESIDSEKSALAGIIEATNIPEFNLDHGWGFVFSPNQIVQINVECGTHQKLDHNYCKQDVKRLQISDLWSRTTRFFLRRT